MYVIKPQLPSRGKFGYTHGSLKSPTIDSIRSFLGLSGSLEKALSAFVQDNNEFSIANLPIGDRDTLFLSLRSIINPNPIDGAYLCSFCNKSVPFVINYEDINVVQLPDDFESPSTIILPVSKETIKLTLVTVEKQNQIENYLELAETSEGEFPDKDLGEDLSLFVQYAVMIENDKSIEKNIEFIRKLDIADFEVFLLYDASFSIGPDISKVCTCSKCKKETKVGVALDQEFLGINLKSLLLKHRFLAKSMNIGFQDFLKYTNTEANFIVEKELEYVNQQKKKGKRK